MRNGQGSRFGLFASVLMLVWGASFNAQAAMEKTVTANGIDFTYLEAGEGPLVILLHGYPETARSWAHVQGRIAAAGFRTIAPFTRGYPPTGPAANGDYSVNALGRDVLALIDALGEKDAVLIGHDWGASTVYEAATRDPSKVRKLVALSVPHPRAVADDPTIFLSAPHFLYYQLPFIEHWVARNDFAHIDGIYASWSPTYAVPDAELADAKAALSAPGGLAGALGYYWSLFDAAQNEDRASSADTEITVPSLIIAGDADGALEVDRFALAESAFTAGYRIEVLENVGHFPQLEAPEKVADLILSFLAE